jgi:hypothetical protein
MEMGTATFSITTLSINSSFATIRITTFSIMTLSIATL